MKVKNVKLLFLTKKVRNLYKKIKELCLKCKECREILKGGWKELVLVVIIGLGVLCVDSVLKLRILDPLLISLIVGLIFGHFKKLKRPKIASLRLFAIILFLSGIFFYGIVGFDFNGINSVDPVFSLLLVIVFITYVTSSLLLSSIFRLKEKVAYLITIGSTICGASAIAIGSKSVDADSNDVSVSVLSVFISSLIGLFIIFPIIDIWLNVDEKSYALLCGGVLQFTGFVKTAVSKMSIEMKELALSVKMLRYIGILVLVPVFSSLIKGRLSAVWYLWVFFGGGLMLSLLPMVVEVKFFLKSVLTVIWSSAMVAVGMSANIRSLITPHGFKAVLVSLISFIIATGVLLFGIAYIL